MSFTVEDQMQLAAAGIKAKKTRKLRELEQRYPKTLDELKRMESQLSRTFNRWNQLRGAVRRMELALDKLDREL